MQFLVTRFVQCYFIILPNNLISFKQTWKEIRSEEKLEDHSDEFTPILKRPILVQDTAGNIPEHGVFIQAIDSNIRVNRRNLQKATKEALEAATSHCYITTPYFLPPHKLKRAIIAAALNGINVKI